MRTDMSYKIRIAEIFCGGSARVLFLQSISAGEKKSELILELDTQHYTKLNLSTYLEIVLKKNSYVANGIEQKAERHFKITKFIWCSK